MEILFITSTRIGDAVLSTSVLSWLETQHPQARITVACGPLVECLFKPFPNVARTIALKKQSYARHWIELWRQAIGTKWDIVVDLRNSAASRLLRADKRFIFSKPDPALHKVEQFAALVNASPPPAPRLWIDEETARRARSLVPDGAPVLGIGPAANWAGKTWPAGNFIALINRLTAAGSQMQGWRVAVFAAPGEEKPAYDVYNALPEHTRVDLIAKGDPLLAAACLARCSFYIGNDSGLMHCAAALGVPTLGLFGPSKPQWYRPWGKNCAYVATPQKFEELIDFQGYDPKTVGSLMGTLTVEAAFGAASDLQSRQQQRLTR